MATSDINRLSPELDQPLQQCWRLGFDDGATGIERGPGDDLVGGIVVDFYSKSIANARSKTILLGAQREAAATRLQEAQAACDAERPNIMDDTGVRTSGAWRRFLIIGYVLMGALAVIAEFALALWTVAESMDLRDQRLDWVLTYSAYGLTAILCVVGLSIKMLVDAIAHRDKGWWATTILATLVVAMTAISIYGLGDTRAAMGDASAQTSTASVPQFNKSAGQGLSNQNLAAESARLSASSAFTFRWLTYTLPCFAALCLVIASDQIRFFRRHNQAQRTIDREGLVARETAIELATLEGQQREVDTLLKDLLAVDPVSSTLQRDATGAYRHGFAVGDKNRQSAIDSLGLYARLSGIRDTRLGKLR